MADYKDLFRVIGDNTDLRDRISVAVAVAAHAVLIEDPVVEERAKWAGRAIDNPIAEADRIYPIIIAANKGASVEDINGANDDTIQTNVDSVVNGLVKVGVLTT